MAHKKRELYRIIGLLSAEVYALKSDNSSHEKLVDNYRHQVKMANRAISDLDNEITALRAKLSIAEARQESDLKTITEINGELKTLRDKHSTLRKRFAARG